MVREWCALYILAWKCAWRHNGVQLFIAHLASWLRTRRFIQPTFRPSGATNHWKNTVFRDFPTFSRICIFFLLTLSLLLFSLLIFLFSLTLSISAFHLSILSEVWLLNFLRYNIWYGLISYRVYYITSFMYLFTWFTYCQFFSWILYHTHTDIVIHQGTSCWASSSGGLRNYSRYQSSVVTCQLSEARSPRSSKPSPSANNAPATHAAPMTATPANEPLMVWRKPKLMRKCDGGGYNCSYHICRKQPATRECCKACTAMKAKTAKGESCKSSCSGETSNSSGAHCNFLASAPSFLFCARSSWIFTSHRSQ